jgi:hypothetical protein
MAVVCSGHLSSSICAHRIHTEAWGIYVSPPTPQTLPQSVKLKPYLANLAETQSVCSWDFALEASSPSTALTYNTQSG